MAIALTLGSGAARGLSHVGVLQWLETHGVAVSVVSGCSMGALVGALFAAGTRPAALRELAVGVRWRSLVRYFRPTLWGAGLLSEEGLCRFLAELLDGLTFEELQLPFACVAADLDTAEEVVFRSGELVPAVAASMAFPGVLAPVRVGQRTLVDGGLVNPVPVDVARQMGGQRVVAVNVAKPVPARRGGRGGAASAGGRSAGRRGGRQKSGRVEAWVGSLPGGGPKVLSELLERIGRERPPAGPGQEWQVRERRFYSVLLDSLTVFSSRILELKGFAGVPHLLIEPGVAGYRAYEFNRAEELIRAGYQAMEDRRDEILRFCAGGKEA